VLTAAQAGLLEALGEQLLETQDTGEDRIADPPAEDQRVKPEPLHLGSSRTPLLTTGGCSQKETTQGSQNAACAARPAVPAKCQTVDRMWQDLLRREQVDHAGDRAETRLFADLLAAAGMALAAAGSS
jgi:hypothetical protein